MKQIITVDVVLLCVHEARLHTVLFAREREPQKGLLALAGGYVHANEDATAFHAAKRVLRDKAGLTNPFLEQFAAFSGRDRDPRGWSVSIDYFALIHPSELEACTVAYTLVPVDDLPPLPFDHADIITTAVEYVRNKGLYTSLAAYLCKEMFSLGQLQIAYEALFGESRTKAQFRLKMKELDFLEQVPGVKDDEAPMGRRSELWRLRPEFKRRLARVIRPI